MLYILDAYNVIHKIRGLDRALDKDLRAAREALVALCAGYASGRGDVSKIILVFDGKTEFHGLPNPAPSKIKIIFSDTGEDADERIILVLEELSKQPRKCVVSDDNFVRNQARAHQTPVMSVAEFETKVRGLKKPKAGGTSSSEKSRLPQNLADQITAAYKKELGL